MVSNSSKVLPFISAAVIIAAMVASALGYQIQVELIVASLPVLTGLALGGLYNKKIEAGIAKYKEISSDPNVKALIDEFVKKLQEGKK